MVDIKAIKEREKKATKRPWKSDERYIVAEVPWGRPGGEVIGQMNPTVQGPRPEYSRSERIANAEFSAHARQDVPDLLDEVEKLREALWQLRSSAKDSEDDPRKVGTVWGSYILEITGVALEVEDEVSVDS